MRRNHPRRAEVNRAMDDGKRGWLSTLVRDISSVNLLITDSPETIDFHRRQWPLMLSVPPGTLIGKLTPFFENLMPDRWVAKAALADEKSESREFRLSWDEVQSENDLRGQWLLAIHPDFASYDSDVGLVLGESSEAPEVAYAESPQAPRYSYRFERWIDHAQAVVAQGAQMASGYRVAARRLGKAYEWSPERVEELVALVCGVHDVGKLQQSWQDHLPNEEGIEWNPTELPSKLPEVGRPGERWAMDFIADRFARESPTSIWLNFRV